MDVTINYWAVLVAAMVNMFVGFMWYGPIFGNHWKKLMGLTNEDMKKMPLTANQAIVLGLITALLMGYVLAYFSALSGIVGLEGAWKLSFWLWLGFMVPITASSFIWEGKKFDLFILNATEQLVALFLMAAVFVLW